MGKLDAFSRQEGYEVIPPPWRPAALCKRARTRKQGTERGRSERASAKKTHTISHLDWKQTEIRVVRRLFRFLLRGDFRRITNRSMSYYQQTNHKSPAPLCTPSICFLMDGRLGCPPYRPSVGRNCFIKRAIYETTLARLDRPPLLVGGVQRSGGRWRAFRASRRRGASREARTNSAGRAEGRKERGKDGRTDGRTDGRKGHWEGEKKSGSTFFDIRISVVQYAKLYRVHTIA